MIITVDGPSASGKGSLARGLAQHLNFYYLDTGSLYRSIGVVAGRQFSHVQIDDGKALTADIVAGWVKDLRYSYDDSGAVLHYKDENITPLLRIKETDWCASHVSKLLAVRDGICEMQRAIAQTHDLIADGRDCGTYIFPDADHKFFLTASLEVRAQRAAGDECRKNDDNPLAQAKQDLLLRDLRDMTRPLRPLRPAEDAIILDVTYLDKQQTLALALSYIR